MDTSLDRSHLRQRYLFAGVLTLDTGLHIGGGRDTSAVTDSPVIRDGLGRPFIPGSSFKGAFRSAVERLLPNLPGFRACGVFAATKGTSNNTNGDGGEASATECLSVSEKLSTAYGVLKGAAARGNKLGLGSAEAIKRHGEALKALRREAWLGETLSDAHLLDVLSQLLCDTCKTFGSPHLAAVAQFHDLPEMEPWIETTQIRDGVGIDRDSERAVPHIKFDYEVVRALSTFHFRLTLENPTDRDLALVALGLMEFIEGMIPLGGIRSRGLGRCRLKDVEMSMVDFTRVEHIQAYLASGWPKSKPLGSFIQDRLNPVLPV
jgi:CRISPR/Cas system CSM-associated protein Csm3 (group 7 of RAMP superfamily)